MNGLAAHLIEETNNGGNIMKLTIWPTDIELEYSKKLGKELLINTIKVERGPKSVDMGMLLKSLGLDGD